jgi:hypothetical protein
MKTVLQELTEAKAKLAAMEGELQTFKATGTMGPWLTAEAAKRDAKIVTLKAQETKLQVEILALKDGIKSLKDGTHPLCIEHAKKMQVLNAKIAQACIASTKPTAPAGMTQARAQAEYEGLPLNQKRAYRVANYQILGCRNEK